MKTISKIQKSITRAQLDNLQKEIKSFQMSDKSALRIKTAMSVRRKEINRLEASNRMKALNAKRAKLRQEKLRMAA